MARSKASTKKAAPGRVERPRKKAQGKAASPRIERPRRAPAPEWDETLKAYLAQIGGRIHEIREIQGLTLAAIEEFTGIDYRQVIRIEQGLNNITVQTAYRIAKALGVETHELYIPRERSSIRAKAAASRTAPPRVEHARKASAPEWDETLKAYLAQIGGRIHEIRQMQGLTLAAIEEFTGIDYRQIIRIEQGEVNITVQTAYRIATALGVETHELYTPRERSSIRAKTTAGDAS